MLIGLCGPIGTDIHFVSGILKTILEDNFGYECIEIKLSDFIRKHYRIQKTKKSFNSTNELIEKGNELREKFGVDILSKFVINQIAKTRLSNSKDDQELFKRKEYAI